MQIDSTDKNPITKGAISRRTAGLIALGFFLVAVLSFVLFYTSIMAFLFFAIHAFFWFSYSGLKIRFKETPIGVFVASFVLWAAAPLIILAQFNYFSNAALSVLLFIFLTYTGREVHHTLLDYESDSARNCNTFAVRVGKIRTLFFEHMLFSTGFLVILLNSLSSRDLILQILSFLYGIGYITIVAVQILSNRMYHNLGFLWKSGRWPFLLGRVYLLVLSLVFLKFSPLISFILFLAFLTYQHRTGKFA